MHAVTAAVWTLHTARHHAATGTESLFQSKDNIQQNESFESQHCRQFMQNHIGPKSKEEVTEKFENNTLFHNIS